MADLLAQFRRYAGPTPPAEKPPALPAPVKLEEEYVAFDAKDKVSRLRIRRRIDPTRSPGYAYLLDIAYDGKYGTNFVLVYPFMMVLVRGKNLQAVVAAIEAGTADFIQEFDVDTWQTPKDAKAPIIESIEVVIPENGPAARGETTENTVH